MFGMTQDQLMGLLRQLLPVIGGVFVALGWVSQGTVSNVTQIIMQIAGPLGIIIGVIWSTIANSKTSILTSAANMPEVKEIALVAGAPDTPSLAGSATPANVVIK